LPTLRKYTERSMPRKSELPANASIGARHDEARATAKRPAMIGHLEFHLGKQEHARLPQELVDLIPLSVTPAPTLAELRAKVHWRKWLTASSQRSE